MTIPREQITGLVVPRNVRLPLIDLSEAVRDQPEVRRVPLAVQDGHHPRVAQGTDALGRVTQCDVRQAVTVEIPGRQRLSEVVTVLPAAWDEVMTVLADHHWTPRR